MRLLYAIVPAISYRLLGCLQAYGSCNLVMVGAGQVWAVGIGLHVPDWPDRRIGTIIVEMGLEGSLKIVVVRPVQHRCCADCEEFLECWDAPERSRKRKITISHDC